MSTQHGLNVSGQSDMGPYFTETPKKLMFPGDPHSLSQSRALVNLLELESSKK